MVEYTYDFIEGTRNQLQAKCDVYPLHNVRNMKDEDIMNELEEYMCELYQMCIRDSNNNILELADILGHESLDTTRIYNVSTDAEKRKKLENMKFSK